VSAIDEHPNLAHAAEPGCAYARARPHLAARFFLDVVELDVQAERSNAATPARPRTRERGGGGGGGGVHGRRT